ncbi:MAG: hypothetical protein WAO98_00410 [Alphaproteobacteria bacterium]
MKWHYTLYFSLFLLVAPVTTEAAEKLTAGDACTSDTNVLDWDTVWQCVSSVWTRAALFIGTTSDTCDSTKAGKLRYNSGDLEVCNGGGWGALSNNAVVPTQGSATGGYFVLTQTTYTGSLNGANLNVPNVGNYGANAVCLTELTTNTAWLGYSTANAAGQLELGKVYAFTGNIDLLPNTTYAFARVGDASAGGATFTTGSTGLGPNDSANWSDATYFNISATYWVFARAPGSNTVWGAASAELNTGVVCSTDSRYDTGTSAKNGSYGSSNSTTSSRWSGTNATCDNTHRLICFVNPP